MGCSEVQLKSLSQSALLHDMQIGYDLVSRIPFLRDAADLVLSHHERYDGTGYPRGLQGEQIPLSARIFAVADAFDAMTSPRPYQATRRVSQAIEEIVLKTGRQFDPQVVQTFLGIPTEVLKEIHGEQKERTYGRPAARQTEMETSRRFGVPVAACG